jgi:hypothetical protein
VNVAGPDRYSHGNLADVPVNVTRARARSRGVAKNEDPETTVPVPLPMPLTVHILQLRPYTSNHVPAPVPPSPFKP